MTISHHMLQHIPLGVRQNGERDSPTNYFFSVLPVGIQSNKEKFKERIEGVDPGAPNNPKIAKKFLITTIITSLIFIVIYYLVKFDLLNLREYLQ